MDDVQVPSFYVLSRKIATDDVNEVLDLLRITPCQAAVISNPLDVALAVTVANEVYSAKSDSEALRLAKEWADLTGRPLLVIGDAKFLDAVMADGTRTTVIQDA